MMLKNGSGRQKLEDRHGCLLYFPSYQIMKMRNLSFVITALVISTGVLKERSDAEDAAEKSGLSRYTSRIPVLHQHGVMRKVFSVYARFLRSMFGSASLHQTFRSKREFSEAK
jgi:hypothetical protein